MGLLIHTPTLTIIMVIRHFVKKILSAVILALTLPTGYLSAVTTIDLPDIGESTGTILSPEYERRLGQAFLNQIRQQADIINDPEVETYIQSIGYRLVAQSDSNSQLFTFFVINDSLINAFAAPGGIVGINSGTIMSSETESELASVMAHEIAHVTQRHMARSAEMTQKMSIPLMAAMLGAILIASQNSQAGAAAIAAVQGGAVQTQINFTRNNEEEADRVGMQLLQRSGFNPSGMPNFFKKLQQNSRYSAQAPEFLRTHPLTTNRIADAEARADSFSVNDKFDESRTYQYIRNKLIVGSYNNPADAVNYFQNQVDHNQGSGNSPTLHYGLALAFMEAKKYDDARLLLDKLLADNRENTSLLLAKADLEVRQQHYNKAIKLYARMHKLFPDYRPLILSYSETLLTAKRPEEARDLLEDYGKFHTPDIIYYEYMTRAEAESGNIINSSMANAEYYFLTGETRVAIEQLKGILHQRNPRLDYYQEQRILSRITQLEQELQIEQDLKLAR